MGVDSALIVTDAKDDNLELSSRNIQAVKVLRSEGLNVYDILLHKKVILVQPVIESLEKRLTA